MLERAGDLRLIDKVIVHHTTNTLLVIGIALGIFMLFSAAMTWLRTAIN